MAEACDAEYQSLLGSPSRDSTSQHPSAPSLLDAHPVLSGSQNAHVGLAEWGEMGYRKSNDAPSVRPPDAEVSPNEVRDAASLDPYPQWIYGALVAPEPQAAPHAGSGYLSQPPPQPSVQALQEDDIRELLVDHVNRNCCWGGKPVKKWDIKQVEDCNVYIGTLETFFEERNILRETEPYKGGPVDGKERGYIPGPWEVDMRKDFPLLFTPVKEALTRLPHSEEVLRCSDCSGRGEVACPICNVGQDPGTYRPGVLTECPDCYGRGLLAHEDGSDTRCDRCGGVGKLRCPTCSSRGLVKCKTCAGNGALLGRKILVVRWRTLQNRKVSASSNAASVPDDIFHKAQGVELHSGQSYQCQPVQFPDSYWVTKLSSDVIAERSPVPPTARIICERHTLSYVPVTRVVMSLKGKSFKSYVVGLKKEVYIKDYPSRCCCGCFSCQSSCSPCCIM